MLISVFICNLGGNGRCSKLNTVEDENEEEEYDEAWVFWMQY
jgi:hypothetical protein